MTDYKYKVSRETSNGIITVETDDVNFVREICEVGIEHVSVDTPNESIDTDWQSIIQKIKDVESRETKIVPMTPKDDHIIPMTPDKGTNPYPWTINPGIYNKDYEDWFKSPFTVTC